MFQERQIMLIRELLMDGNHTMRGFDEKTREKLAFLENPSYQVSHQESPMGFVCLFYMDNSVVCRLDILATYIIKNVVTRK